MRVTKDPAERRQEILDAALEVLLERGYEKTSIKDIVSKVGVAQGLFYYYFSSKEDMIKAICKQYEEKFVNFLNDAGLADCKDAIEAIKILIIGMFKFTDENLQIVHKLHQKGYKSLHDMITMFMVEALTKVLTDIIKLGNKQGKFHCDYPDKSAVAFVFGAFIALHDDANWEFIDRPDSQKGFIISLAARILVVDEQLLDEII